MRQEDGQKKRPTQADVARRAVVSQALVSYVVNNHPDVSVPEATRRRVLDAVTELGYVPDSAARSLRTRKTFTVACIIPDITNPFYPAFERGVQEGAEQQGYVLVVYNTDGDAEREARCLGSVREGRADGVVGVFFHRTAEDLRPLLDRGVPVVRLEATRREVGPLPLDNIYVDNTQAAGDAVTYLIARGHRRIGMIAGHGGPRQARVLGYRRALEEHGLAVDEGLIRAGDFREGGGADAMRELLSVSPRPTAVFAANDVMAMGALLAVRAAGLRVPAEMAVVGFDDIPAARLVHPPLTTVAQFPERLGRRAAAMLFERLAGTVAEGGRNEAMPYELIVRESG